MSTLPNPRPLVIGVGNPDRGDDAVGLLVARRLRQFGYPLTVVEAPADGAALIECWKEAQTVIVIDAIHAGQGPGRILRFDARAAAIPVELFRCSTHAFGLTEGIELARALNQLPARLTVYGIVAKHFAVGATVAAEVEVAVPQVIDLILDELRTAAGEG